MNKTQRLFTILGNDIWMIFVYNIVYPPVLLVYLRPADTTSTGHTACHTPMTETVSFLWSVMLTLTFGNWNLMKHFEWQPRTCWTSPYGAHTHTVSSPFSRCHRHVAAFLLMPQSSWFSSKWRNAKTFLLILDLLKEDISKPSNK